MDELWEPEIIWYVISLPGNPQLPSRMHWRADHPLEIKVFFGSTGTNDKENPGDVSWVFSRDLIREARLKTKAGQGDVKIGVYGNEIILELTSPMGTARLQAPYPRIDKFVARTFAEVSVATEIDCLPLSDDNLYQLLETWKEDRL